MDVITISTSSSSSACSSTCTSEMLPWRGCTLSLTICTGDGVRMMRENAAGERLLDNRGEVLRLDCGLVGEQIGEEHRLTDVEGEQRRGEDGRLPLVGKM